MSLHGSTGIDEELHAKGQRLLRLVVRAYFDVEYSILITAFLHLAPSGQSVRASQIAERLHIGEKQVGAMLGILSQLFLISRNTVVEEKPVIPGVISRHSRTRTFEEWRTDYESVVKVVTFKHSEMLKRLDIPTDKVEFTCSNDSCIYSGKIFSLEEVAMSSLLTSRARERQSISGVIDAGSLVGSSSAAAGAGAGADAGGDSGAGDHAAFRCTYCGCAMKELAATVDGMSAGDLKRQFNEQADEINEAMRDVERLLKERYEVLAARGSGAEMPSVGGGAAGGGPATGVGAKVGLSSAADLANRVEKNKSLLAWDRLTSDEKAARDRDEAARIAAAAEQAAKLAEANEIRAREAEREAELRRQEHARTEAMLEAQLMASALGADATEAAAAAAAAAAKATAAAAGSEGETKAEDGTVPGSAMYASEGANGHHAYGAEEEEEEEPTFMVQGVPVKLSDITDAHVDSMTDAENAAYSAYYE